MVTTAPKESATADDKTEFYNNLEDHLEQVKTHDMHLVVGKVNARVGSDSHYTHPEVIGRHCIYEETNDNGKRLVAFCEEHKLIPVQITFPQPKQRLWTWRHPTGSTHQLEHILINSQ